MSALAEPIFIKVADHKIRADRVQHVYCEGCKANVAPDPTAPNLGHECPHGIDLSRELEYQLEFGFELCEACGRGTFPGLGETHACPQSGN